MKTLLTKEMLVLRTNLLAVCIWIGIMVYLMLAFGNLWSIAIVVPLLVTQLLQFDEQGNWLRRAMLLPVSRRLLVKEKFVILAWAVVLAFVPIMVLLGYQAVLAAQGDESALLWGEIAVAGGSLVTVAVMIYALLAPTIAVHFKFQNTFILRIYLLVAFICAFFLCGLISSGWLYFGYDNYRPSSADLFNRATSAWLEHIPRVVSVLGVMTGIIVFLLVVIALEWRFTVRLVERKDF